MIVVGGACVVDCGACVVDCGACVVDCVVCVPDLRAHHPAAKMKLTRNQSGASNKWVLIV